jgi:hypothetical protein
VSGIPNGRNPSRLLTGFTGLPIALGELFSERTQAVHGVGGGVFTTGERILDRKVRVGSQAAAAALLQVFGDLSCGNLIDGIVQVGLKHPGHP